MTARAERYPWWLEPASWLGALLVRLLGRTWRIDEHNDPDYDRARRDGRPLLYAFWHARMLPLVYTHRGEGAAVLVSRHRDGQLITRIIERLGLVTGRGSSTRGGDSGVRELLAWAEAGRTLAITPDGPRGPAERAKEGIVYVAARTGLPVVPIATSSPDSQTWVLRSWDRFRVPRPFARVVIEHGTPQPMAGPQGSDAAAVEGERLRLEQRLHELTAAVAARSGEGR